MAFTIHPYIIYHIRGQKSRRKFVTFLTMCLVENSVENLLIVVVEKTVDVVVNFLTMQVYKINSGRV